MKIVISRNGQFKMTLYLMQLYWEKSICGKNKDQPCFEQTDRPDLILDYAQPIHPDMDLTWDGIDEEVLYCITTCELIKFKDCLASRIDEDFIAAVEESIFENHSLEVITAPQEIVEKDWKIFFDETKNREFIDINILN